MMMGLAILSPTEDGEEAMLTAEVAARGGRENGDDIGVDATISSLADQYRAVTKQNIRCDVAYCYEKVEMKITGAV
jgi:hypothetical protein